MSENVKNATDLIEQGHVRVGTEMIKDPAFLVARTLEDFVTWVDGSAIRKHVLEYNNIVSFEVVLLAMRLRSAKYLRLFVILLFFRETILSCRIKCDGDVE